MCCLKRKEGYCHRLPHRHETVKASDVPDAVSTSGRDMPSYEVFLQNDRIYSAVWPGYSPKKRWTVCSRVRFLSALFRFSEPHWKRFLYLIIYAYVCEKREVIHCIHLLLCQTGKDLDPAFSFPVKDYP